MTEYLHKTGKKNETFNDNSIMWSPHNGVNYEPTKINSVRWEIYAQEDIQLEPKQIKLYTLNFGVAFSLGLVVVSLVNDLKLKRICIQNETVVENVEDIVISIQNNADSDFSMKAGEKLCHLTYHK